MTGGVGCDTIASMYAIATWTAEQWEAIGIIVATCTFGYLGIVKLIEWKGRK